MASEIVIPGSRWHHLREYGKEVLDHMNGGTYKQNEDGSINIALTRIKPDKIANALRRLFYIALTAAVAIIGNQSRSVPQILQEALTPQSVAGYLRDPDVKAALGDILKEVLAPVEFEQDEKPKPKPTNAKPKRKPPPEPQRLNRLRDDDLIAPNLPSLPMFGYNRIPIPPMEHPE